MSGGYDLPPIDPATWYALGFGMLFAVATTAWAIAMAWAHDGHIRIIFHYMQFAAPGDKFVTVTVVNMLVMLTNIWLVLAARYSSGSYKIVDMFVAVVAYFALLQFVGCDVYDSRDCHNIGILAYAVCILWLFERVRRQVPFEIRSTRMQSKALFYFVYGGVALFGGVFVYAYITGPSEHVAYLEAAVLIFVGLFGFLSCKLGLDLPRLRAPLLGTHVANAHTHSDFQPLLPDLRVNRDITVGNQGNQSDFGHFILS